MISCVLGEAVLSISQLTLHGEDTHRGPDADFTGVSKSQNHRIMEWFGVEGTLKIIWFPPPCQAQGHLPLGQVAQSPIQPGLEHCHGGGIHSFSGQSAMTPGLASVQDNGKETMNSKFLLMSVTSRSN